MSYLSTNLRRLRLSRGTHFTQQRVADDINVTRSRYASWELATAEPDITKLLRLAGYYQVGLDVLLRKDLTKLTEHSLGITCRLSWSIAVDVLATKR